MTKKTTRWIAIIGVIVLVILIGWFVGQRNRLVTMQEEIDGAWSEVENQLQRRSDLIPNLVSTVRGFAEQEQAIFDRITDARAALAGAQSVSETAESFAELEGALSRLLVLTEDNPEIQSNENFIRLQDELAGTENRIAVARRRYNEAVQGFNTRIQLFPSSLAADALSMEQRDYFEVPDAALEAPEVDFSGNG